MSKNRRQYIESKLAEVERERDQNRYSDDQIAELLVAYSSPDAEVRAAALKKSCPCHVSWDIYERLRKRALKLRRDRDPHVRALALHLEEDAGQIARAEAARRRWLDRDEELAEKRRQRRKDDRHRRARHG